MPSTIIRFLAAAVLAALVAAAPALAAEPRARAAVVKGERAPAGAYPWFVALSIGCGGSLVAPDRVLTAAHCVQDLEWDQLEVFVGARRARSTTSYDGRRVAVAAVASHPSYRVASRNTPLRDLALIRLTEPVTGVRPVPLAPASSTGGGRPALVAGFGIADVTGGRPMLPRTLRRGRLRLLSERMCRRAFGRSFDRRLMLCARDRDGRSPTTSPCLGDSGGPLTVTVRGRARLAGVVSFGAACGYLREPSVYARTATLRTFVHARRPTWAPAPIGTPRLGGALRPGGTATCTGVTWANRPAHVEYRWRVGEEILTPTSAPSRVLPEGSAGEILECRVAASNRGGLVRSPVSDARPIAAR